MQFIFGYPEFHGADGDMLDAGPIGHLAAAAEAAGWHGFSLTEHPSPGAKWLDAGGHQSLDPFVALAFAAATTQRLRLLTYLTVVPYRNPLLLAKTAATLDRLSNGRLILGAGTGYLKSEFFALGVDFDERNALFDEALDVLPMAWRGERFSYVGTHFGARDVVQLPRPTQNPIPIWIGGNAKITRRRVAERAQGWMPLAGPIELSRTARSTHIGGIADLGGMISDMRVQAGDRGAGIDVLFPYIDPTIRSLTSDVERHRDVLGQLEAMGVNWVAVSAPRDSPSAASDFAQGFAETFF